MIEIPFILFGIWTINIIYYYYYYYFSYKYLDLTCMLSCINIFFQKYKPYDSSELFYVTLTGKYFIENTLDGPNT